MLSDMPKAIKARKTSTALTVCCIFLSLTVKSMPNIRAANETLIIDQENHM